MNAVALVPMLRVQRDLYDIPRGLVRFRRYLDVMIGGTDDIALPLPAFNPMGKDHVAATLDALIALDAEAIAAEAIAEASRTLPDLGDSYRLGLVVADDKGGGWTNRHFTEIGDYFGSDAMRKRGWIVPLFWTSEAPSRESVRQEVLATLHRTASLLRVGRPGTLRALMEQEGRASAFAGRREPALDDDDLAYSREVIRPHLDSDDLPVLFACLFGDPAARSVGYTPLGLSPRAGLAVALADSRGIPNPADSGGVLPRSLP